MAWALVAPWCCPRAPCICCGWSKSLASASNLLRATYGGMLCREAKRSFFDPWIPHSKGRGVGKGSRFPALRPCARRCTEVHCDPALSPARRSARSFLLSDARLQLAGGPPMSQPQFLMAPEALQTSLPASRPGTLTEGDSTAEGRLGTLTGGASTAVAPGELAKSAP